MDYTGIKNKFTSLVKKYGVVYFGTPTIETFNICSDEGIELDGSTIDKIELEGNDIKIYYNENENDFDYIEDFELKDLNDFYCNLASVLENNCDDTYSESVEHIKDNKKKLEQ